MSTTSLKLPDEVKQQAAKAAEQLGISPHAFMVDAIRQAAEAVGQRAQFVAQAVEARTQMVETGLGHDADDVRTYLRKRIDDQQTPRPDAKTWRK